MTMDAQAFSVGYMRFSSDAEEIFLSVTPGFEHGPGIQRDGISSPRMTDPHCVAYVANARKLKRREPAQITTDGYQQRAGTWTLYNHLANFQDKLGKHGWRILGVQGHGDLTMNYWHVAYCNDAPLNPRAVFCRLNTEEDHSAREPFSDRTYRCMVKWKDATRKPRLEFRDVRFLPASRDAGVTLHLVDDEDDRDRSDEVSLAMAGKTIIENRIELPLEAIIDRFDDVRHIFALPETPARGFLYREEITKAILGEYNLFRFINERRAALYGPVVIPLQPERSLAYDWDQVQKRMIERHFRPTGHTSDIPTLRGQFRKYPGLGGGSECIEVFFPRNVYPFGVLGMRTAADAKAEVAAELICFSSGGLSGKIGNTLEGVTRVVYDFLACGEAMVVDEGLDVFQLVNPRVESKESEGKNKQSTTPEYKYNNEDILNSVARYTRLLLEQEEGKCHGMRALPLNREIFSQIPQAPKTDAEPQVEQIFSVIPQRSQIRAVIIAARNEGSQPNAARNVPGVRKSPRHKPRAVATGSREA